MIIGKTDLSIASSTACLTDEEFFGYLSGAGVDRSTSELEQHLSRCARCRKELADLICVLHPEKAGDAEQKYALSPADLDQTLRTVRQAGRVIQLPAPSAWHWQQWLSAAAAVILMVGLGSLALNRYLQGVQARDFFEQGRTALQQVYIPQSQNGLRLDLPYHAAAQQRSGAKEDEALRDAERFFYQTLALRDKSIDARLGLAYVHLKNGRFSKAHDEFQEILKLDAANLPAMLGHGVTCYEEARAAKDPLQRLTQLEISLADFDAVLKKNPAASEASFNRVHVLYELGRHQEALQEIDKYLEREPKSPWADQLRNLQIRMRFSRADAVEKEIHAAAQTHDVLALERLARAVPYRMHWAIRITRRNALGREGMPAEVGKPDAQSLEWAAEIMESAHRANGGDVSSLSLFKFYNGLSPPQRELKKNLDRRFQEMVELHKKGDVRAALRGTESLIGDYTLLQDHWQITYLHHLRGNCYFYNGLDMEHAFPEYLEMLESAERAEAPDLIATALGCLSLVCGEQQRFEQGIGYLQRMQTVAASHGQLPALGYASRSLGYTYALLNQYEDSLSHYCAALALGQQLWDEELLVATLRGIASVMENQNRISEARRFVREARQSREAFSREGSNLDQHKLLIDRLNLIYREGTTALRMSDFKAAEACFQEGLGILATESLPELEARHHLGLAQVYFAQNNLPGALEEAAKSLAGNAERSYPQVGWQALQIQGAIARQSGNPTLAFAYFQRAIDAIERVRREIKSVDLRRTYLIHRFNPYQEMVSLLYHTGRITEALQYVERAKSMTLRESLARYINHSDSMLDIQLPNHSPYPEFVPAGMTIFEYFITPDETLLFISSRKNLQAVPLKISLTALDELGQRFMASMKGKNETGFNELSRQLYDVLVKPALDAMTDPNVGTLVILPDGPLHSLPFAAFKDSRGRYLIERFPISYAPSFSVLQYCLDLKRSRLSNRPSILLLNGTSNLPGANAELTHLMTLFGNRASLLGSRALASFPLAASTAEIIHFAGHARFRNGRPYLELSSADGELLLEPANIMELKLKSNRLVALAGCSTGIGPTGEGETPWGFLPAFFSAGAPALLVSLLPLEDLATSELCKKFYLLYTAQSISKAAALQQVQISMLKSANPRTAAHALSWAPLVLVGDPS